MKKLPSLIKGTFAVAIAALLSASTVNASNLSDAVALLLPKTVTIQTATAAQLATATLKAIGTNTATAGNYVHDVLVIRTDADKSGVASALSKAVILKLPSSATSVGTLVAADILTTDAQKAAFVAGVAVGLSPAGNNALGALCAGVAANVSNVLTFTTAAASGATSLEKGFIAQGIVKVSGTANTVNVIKAVLAADAGAKTAVTAANLAVFTSAVAGATTGLSADAATALMEKITNTIAGASYIPAVGKPTALLTLAQKEIVGAAAVNVAPTALVIDQRVNPASPANAAIRGILGTMATLSPTDASAFAAGVVKGALNYENAAQVANAVGAYLTLHATPLVATATTAPDYYVSLGASVIKALPNAASQISQRIAQLIPPNVAGVSQAARADFAKQLAAAYPGSAKLIAVGVSLTDVQYADDVARAVVSANAATKGSAAVIAGALANIVPAEYACEISAAMGGLIKSNVLKVTQAAAIATAIAGGTVKNSPDELQVVAAQMIGQLLENYHASTDKVQVAINKAIVTAVGAVAKTVATIAYKNNGAVAANAATLVAGASFQIALASGITGLDLTTITAAITKAVTGVTPTLSDHLIPEALTAATHNSSAYNTACLNGQETPVTNF